MKKTLVAILASAILAASLTACNQPKNNTESMGDGTQEEYIQSSSPEQTEDELTRYNRALSLLASGNIEEAYGIFLTIKNFQDVSDYLECFSFQYEKCNVQDPEISYTVSYEYDEYGRRLVQEIRYPDSFRNVRCFYQYDEKGNLVRSGIKVGDSDNQITVYEYDEAGNPTRQIDPCDQVTVLEYDSDGNITKVIDSDGNIRERTYDIFGNLTEECFKMGNGFLIQTVSYEYNEKGDVVKRTLCETGGTTYIEVYQYEYDEMGNMTKLVTNPQSGTDAYRKWEYDVGGNVTKHEIYHSDTDYVIFYSTYDENGNKTEEYREDEDGISYYRYFEYDVYGNLLKSTQAFTDPLEEGETVEYEYTGYKLYYNPYEVRELPVELVGKG